MAKPAPPRMTVAELGRRLKLSRATVSLVLNGQAEAHRIPPATIARVQEAAHRLRYRPNMAARQLAGKRSNAVGVLISTQAIADIRLVQAMELRAAERGLRFIIGQAVGTPERVQEYLDDFRDRGVDGVISIFHNHPDFRETVLPELARFPNVVYYEKPQHRTRSAVQAAWYVQPDYAAAARLGVQALVERGRRRIGLVLNNRIFSYAEHRYRAHREAIAAAGYGDDRLIWIMGEQPGIHWADPFTEELALQAVDALVVEGGADGIVAVNDLYAARLMRALRLRGRRVPGDVAIIGCDHLEFGPALEPPLTTIDLGGQALVDAMMELVFSQLDGRGLPRAERQRIIAPELIVREST